MGNNYKEVARSIVRAYYSRSNPNQTSPIVIKSRSVHDARMLRKTIAELVGESIFVLSSENVDLSVGEYYAVRLFRNGRLKWEIT